MNKNSKILVTGGNGMLGFYLLKELKSAGYSNIINISSVELDLTDYNRTAIFIENEKPDYVFFLAARTGGVGVYNDFPVEFLRDNLRIELNIIEACHKVHVKKMVFTSAGCIYPEINGSRLYEDMFRSSWVQKSTESYGLAKAVGTVLCDYYAKEYGDRFVSVLPANIYGYSDESHFNTNSVIPAMIRSIINAKRNSENEVVIWGDGTAKREFLHAYDCARGLIEIMESSYDYGIINIGVGEMTTINELSQIISNIVGFEGSISHDLTKPNGGKRSVLDCSRINSLGWCAEIDLCTGIRHTVKCMENKCFEPIIMNKV